MKSRVAQPLIPVFRMVDGLERGFRQEGARNPKQIPNVYGKIYRHLAEKLIHQTLSNRGDSFESDGASTSPLSRIILVPIINNRKIKIFVIFPRKILFFREKKIDR